MGGYTLRVFVTKRQGTGAAVLGNCCRTPVLYIAGVAARVS
jgi:S-methylmethionine-dependent homocysteine/selenocysteine methylase